MKREEILNSVGRRRVRLVDEDTGEEVGRGILKSAAISAGPDAEPSEAVVELDFPTAGGVSE